MNLPNIKNTWKPLGYDIESFEEWVERNQQYKGSREVLLSMYLDELWMRHKPKAWVGKLGALGGCDLAQEVAHAYLALMVAQNPIPAERFIKGERLHPDLHPEYVLETVTLCYG